MTLFVLLVFMQKLDVSGDRRGQVFSRLGGGIVPWHPCRAANVYLIIVSRSNSSIIFIIIIIIIIINQSINLFISSHTNIIHRTM